MGSTYLLAHGLGVPVQDAVTTVQFAKAGSYGLWVRTRDWVAPWKTPDTPPDMRATGSAGIFQVLVDGVAVPVTFGAEGADWHWQDGGDLSQCRKSLSPYPRDYGLRVLFGNWSTLKNDAKFKAVFARKRLKLVA